jgi:hypothetical protein
MKRRIKVWGKFNLYEASAVGLPAYPDAHARADSFSLVKSLTNASLKTGFVEEGETMKPTKVDELNYEEEKEAMVENTEVPTEKKVDETTEKKVETEKSEDSLDIAKAIAEGIKLGLKELEIERGVVEKQVPKKKSIGEMAVEQGFFVTR